MAEPKKKAGLYRIGQVAKLTGIQAFVLRFWEKEFNLKLPKAKSGHRFYRQKDIQKILTIKRLLYTEGYTIKGAMQKLTWGEAEPAHKAPAKKLSPREANFQKTMQHIRGDLEQILTDLKQMS